MPKARQGRMHMLTTWSIAISETSRFDPDHFSPM